jgi:hypothetical protein
MGINDLGDGLERELVSWDANEFWDDKSDCGQHGSTTVFQFRLTEPWNPFGGALLKKRRNMVRPRNDENV